jgi:hypothetical protein
VHCFLLGGVAYGEADLLVLSISVAGLFFFCISFSFFCLCASFIPSGHDVVAEAWCIGIFDINKYSLSKNTALTNV